MFPILVIVIGITVLLLGQRLAVMGAAVGLLLGVGLLALFPGDSGPWITLGLPIAFALVGLFAGGFAKGIVEVVVLVIGALAGAAIVLAFLNIFRIDLGLVNWLLALVGGVIGLIAIRRSRKASKDWGMIILASLVGGLLIARGIAILIPSLDSTVNTLIVLALTAGGIVYQGGFLNKSQTDASDSSSSS